MNPSPGKLRGLQQCSTIEGIFTILALDHSPAYFMDGQAEYAEIFARKAQMLSGLSGAASAVLLDPIHGLGAAVFGKTLAGRTGLLLAAEDGSYQDPGGDKHAKILDGWSIEKIKSVGASAVKLFFYYHPDDHEKAAIEEAFVRDVAAECRTHDIPLFAEPLSYNTAPADRPRVVIETARRISALDIDVLKVEFPVDSTANPDEEVWREACQALDSACRTPWALLSAGVGFETFSRQVEIACHAGASGFLAGRAIWGEAAKLTGKDLDRFINEVARPRLDAISSIAVESGRPWQDCFQEKLSVPPEGWFKTYQGGG